MTTRRLAALALTLLLAVTLAPAPPAEAATVRLDGVTVVLQPRTTQVITVNHTRGWHARVTFWQRVSSGWRKVKQVKDGRTGYGGLVVGTKRKQGTGSTPLGTYGLISSFGTHARAATWDLPYRKIRAGDYWVQDNASRYYNRYRNKAAGRLPLEAPLRGERLRAADGLPEAVRVRREHQLQLRARCATAAPGSSCTSTAAGRRRAASRCRAGSCAR